MNCSMMRQRAAPQAGASQPRARLPAAVRQRVVALPPLVAKPRRRAARAPTTIVCGVGGSGLAHPNEEAAHGESGSGRSSFNPMMAVPSVTMAKGGGGGNFGSGGSLGATLEKSKLEFVMPTPPAQAPKLDDGGSGGDIGKGIHNGGGGGDDGGDDDDYFNEDGDGDGEGEEGKDTFFRTVIPESYDKLSIGAVFAEWMRTVAELPLILRRAVEMGLFSSAQLVRFFSMDVRPNVTRTLSRALPPAWARDFVGRLMADPAFVQKMVLESTIAACASLWYEYRARGERFKDELDLVLINTMGMAAATGATVWMVAPTRSYGSVHKFPWQQMLDGLPNCVFDVNGPLRTYSTPSRVGAFFTKAAELSAVGLLMGGATSLLSSAAVALRRKYVDPSFEPSVPIPEVARSSAGLAAFFAVSANTRYQLIGGMDRYLVAHSNFLWTYLGLTGVARALSCQVGELHRSWCQGLPEPSAPRKKVVRKKVVVRRKVLRPVEQQQLVALPAADGAVQQLDVAASVAGAAAAGALVASSSSAAAAAGQQQFDEPLVLDQVLAMSGPSEVGQQQQQELHAAEVGSGASHAAEPHGTPSSAAELQSLVVRHSSGALQLPGVEQVAAVAGQLVGPSGAVLTH